MTPLVTFLVVIFLFSLVSRRLEHTVLTAPIVFAAAGALTALLHSETPESGGLEVFLRVAEIGLVLLLFTDASRTRLAVLRSIRNLPVRLLGPGMLLTMLLGLLAARAVFPQLSLWEAGILAAILAPTDAGLGQIIVTSTRVPLRKTASLAPAVPGTNTVDPSRPFGRAHE
jgi:NhaP-type Na+/H+ or K+/H+ antiporter